MVLINDSLQNGMCLSEGRRVGKASVKLGCGPVEGRTQGEPCATLAQGWLGRHFGHVQVNGLQFAVLSKPGFSFKG